MQVERAFEIADMVESRMGEISFVGIGALEILETVIGTYPDVVGAELKAACTICRERGADYAREKDILAFLDRCQPLYEEGSSLQEVAERRARHGDPLAIEYLEWKPHPSDMIFEALLDAAGEAHPNWHRAEIHEGVLRWQPIDREQGMSSQPDLVAWFRITHPEETAEIEARILEQLRESPEEP